MVSCRIRRLCTPRATLLGLLGHDSPELQATEPQQIVRRPNQEARMLRTRHASEPALAQAADRFHPPENLLDLLPQPLAETVAGVPGRPAI